ncbi:pilus assembly protein PilM [Paenibacillus sabinae]|uniref:Fimbrial assembly family protein n=1 Tax=Paenibacillus sabinae T27 TaxID=1268072 RepID=X4ZIQ3_9BACL|nr:pilus assembly protein PilM [Paenibacillus sabinae]AHV99321.1 fimbrial assembly family protein [Paenibacillus sabinae T27]
MLGLSTPAAGLAIEQTGIRYISLKNKKSWEVRKKRFLPLPQGMIVANQVAESEALLDLVKQWVKKEGLRGSRIALSIPPSQIIIRKMTIPSANDKQVGQLVKLEVETGLHLPFDNPVYDYVVTEVDEDQSHLLVFAAPRKPIQEYIDILEKAGLRVTSVEIAATALARSLSTGKGESFEETMLINMEQSMLDVYMFRSGNPVFIRTINLMDLSQSVPQDNAASVSDWYMAEAAASSEEAHKQLSPEQVVEITAEILRMLNFYQYSLHDGSTRIKNVLIAGAPDARRQLFEELHQSLTEQDVSMIGLEQLAASANVPDSGLNDYRVAVGAALRGSGFLTIDLYPREDREAMLFPYIATALAGIWLLGTIGTGIYYVAEQGRISNNIEQIQGAQDRGTMLQAELAKLNGDGGQLNRKAAVGEILKYKMNIVSVLNELASGLPQGSALRNINYTYRTSIDLTVKVPRMEDASIYLARLRQMSFTVDASIQKLTEGDTGAGPVSAALTKSYTAIYKVNLTPNKPKEDADGTNGQENQGEEAGSGTNQ